MSDETADTDGTTGDSGVFHRIEEGDVSRTGGRTVTEADLVNFAGVSGDFNRLHTDEERMADSTFGARIAHGMFVLSAATGLIWQHRSVEEREAVVAFYGIDNLRFRNPTLVGDTIYAVLEVLETERKPEGPGTGTVRYGLTVENQREETILSCEMITLLE